MIFRRLIPIFCLLLAAVRAGNGPQNWLVVYDPGDAHGVAIARHYQIVRGFPDRNLFPYSFPRRAVNSPSLKHELTLAETWSFITALRAGIAARGLDGQVHGVTLVGHAPNALKLSAGSGNASASMTTAIMMSPDTTSAAELEVRIKENNAVVRLHLGGPAVEVRSDTLHGGKRYLMATHLGFIGLQALRPDEVMDMITRSAAADGTAPDGTIYWPLNINTRSEMREDQAPLIEPEWQALGIDYQIYGQAYGGGGYTLPENKRGAPGSLPVTEKAVRGALVGSESFDLLAQPSLYTPGAIAEHVTSFGAQFGGTLLSGQTRCAVWIRAGASGTSGTVNEPFAVWERFPHARIHSHYAMGASLAEAFFLTVKNPVLTLTMGDGLTQAYAKIPVVTLAGIAPGQTLAGTVALGATATGADGVEPLLDLAVDGRVVKIGASGETVGATRVAGGFEINTTTLTNGWHELRVIAYGATGVRTQGQAVREAQVQNGAGSVTLTGPAAVTFGANFSVTAAVSGLSGVSSVEVRALGQVLATLGAGGGTASIAASRLAYAGGNRLFAVARFSDGREAFSAPLAVAATWTPAAALADVATIPGAVAVARIFPNVSTGGFNWNTATPAAVVPVSDRFAVAVEKADQWPFLDAGVMKAGQTGGVEFITRFFARETGIYDFATLAQGNMGLSVDGVDIVAGTLAGSPQMPTVPLAAGWHELRVRVRIGTFANANIRPFEANFRSRSTTRFHYEGNQFVDYENFTLTHCTAPANVATTLPRLAARVTGAGAAALAWTDPFTTETGWRVERYIGDPGAALTAYSGTATAPTLHAQGSALGMKPGALTANDTSSSSDTFTVVPPFLQQGARLLTAQADRSHGGSVLLHSVSVPAGTTIYAIANSYGELPPWMTAQGGWTVLSRPDQPAQGTQVQSLATNLWSVFSRSITTAGTVQLGGPVASGNRVPSSQAITYVFVKNGAHWQTLSSPAANATSASVSGLASSGTHRLRVTAQMPPDASIPSNEITLSLAVAEANGAPSVSAGPDLQSHGTAAAVTLNGWAHDDGLPGALSTSWSQVGGPGTVNFANATTAATSATFSAPGTYTLRLTASDGDRTAQDDVLVTIAPDAAQNLAPVVNAGADTSLDVLQSATLTGSATDDGLPAPARLLYDWRLVSGPAAPVFEDARKPTSAVYFPLAGTYTLELRASDGLSSGTDTVVFTITAAAPPNAAPVVSLAANHSALVNQPLALTGSASDDGLPGALSYRWVRLSGPGSVTFSAATAASTSATFSTAGTHTLLFSASDGDRTSFRTTEVVSDFSGAGNQPPVVTLGADQTLLFTESAFVSVAASDDGLPSPPGALTLTCSKVSGPGRVFARLLSGNASAQISFDQPGDYEVRLTAGDGLATGSDTVRVVVSAEASRQIIWAWGYNQYGALGGFDFPAATSAPAPVGRRWRAWAPEYDTTVAVDARGTVLASGFNHYGQLGAASVPTRTHFAVVPGLPAMVDVTHAGDTLAALGTDGRVWTWGFGLNGTLGIGSSPTQQPVPAALTGIADVAALFGGGNSFAALKTDGTLWLWGFNGTSGKLGLGDTTNRNTPTPLPAIANARQVAFGTGHTLFLRADGTVSASGYNFYGQLGIGLSGTGTHRTTPVAVLTSGSPDVPLTGIVKIAAGPNSSFALDAAGRVWAWGDNNTGQLGVNDLTDRTYATRVLDPGDASGFLTGIVDIASGSSTTFALKSSGSVLAWGNSAFGAFGSGQLVLNRVVPGPVGGLPPVVALRASANSFTAITAAASYTDFTATHFTAPEIAAGQAAPGHDSLASGRPNLLAYALGENPRVPAALPPLLTALSSGEYIVETELLGASGDLEISFESSTDLIQWLPATPTSATVLDLGDFDRHTLRFDLGTSPDQLFLRMKINLLNP